jgi:Trk-type K+ transport system membrane component
MHALVVLRLLGLVVMLFAGCMLLPLVFSLALADAALSAHFRSVLITLAAGGVLWLATRRAAGELQIRDGFLLVALVWTTLPAFATLPLLFYIPGLSFTNAYFEATSGLTASGGTVLSGLDQLPPSINLWRGFMIWLGGMGVIVLAVAILPLLGVGGSQIFKAETPGPMKDTKLTPRIAETAKGLWLVYFALTGLCLLAYRWAGMTWLDALMHSFTTMGLGGFSTHDASFAYWNSPKIEAVAIVFMMIAAINFATHFLAWSGFPSRPTAAIRKPRSTSSCWSARCAASHSICIWSASIRTHGARCVSQRSMWFRSRRRPDTQTPTTTRGRSSLRSGCCSCAASSAAQARPAAASRWSARRFCSSRSSASCCASSTRACSAP